MDTQAELNKLRAMYKMARLLGKKEKMEEIYKQAMELKKTATTAQFAEKLFGGKNE